MRVFATCLLDSFHASQQRAIRPEESLGVHVPMRHIMSNKSLKTSVLEARTAGKFVSRKLAMARAGVVYLPDLSRSLSCMTVRALGSAWCTYH